MLEGATLATNRQPNSYRNSGRDSKLESRALFEVDKYATQQHLEEEESIPHKV